MPTQAEILAMLARMHNTAADSELAAGEYASGANQDQLAAKYRNASQDTSDEGEENENNGD